MSDSTDIENQATIIAMKQNFLIDQNLNFSYTDVIGIFKESTA